MATAPPSPGASHDGTRRNLLRKTGQASKMNSLFGESRGCNSVTFGKILPLSYELGTHREAVTPRCDFPSLQQRGPRRRGGERNNTEEKRGVSFSTTTSARFVRSRHEYTPQEISACWYDDEESSEMTADTVRTIRAFRRGNGEENDCLCPRGLETMLDPEALSLRQRTKRAVIDAVLDEQDRQYGGGLGPSHRDEETLRREAIRVTGGSARRAVRLAIRDQAFVRSEQASERRRNATAVAQSPWRRTDEHADDDLANVLIRAKNICEEP